MPVLHTNLQARLKLVVGIGGSAHTHWKWEMRERERGGWGEYTLTGGRGLAALLVWPAHSEEG